MRQRSATSRFGVTPGQRFSTGITATVRDEYGETYSRHLSGMTKDALRDLAEWCDRMGAVVVSISTPGTIYRDLHGSRRTMVDAAASLRVSAYTEHTTDRIDVPEGRMLGWIGRGDLLDARSEARYEDERGEPTTTDVKERFDG